MRHNIQFERLSAKMSIEGSLFFNVVEQQEEERTIINVQGVIGDPWDGLDASQFVSVLQEIKTPITLRINTPGGIISDALDAFDAINNHEQHVRADIVAEAWSAGSIITAAADEVRIAPAGRFGIHQACAGFLIMGNADEIRRQMPQLEADLKTLDKLTEQIAGILADKSGNDHDQVLQWMKGEEGVDGSEFVGEEAVNAGFADSMIPVQTNLVKSQIIKAAEARLRAATIKMRENRVDESAALT